MKFGKMQTSHSATYFQGFGGQSRDFLTKNSMPMMSFQTRYNYQGNGRDTYIGHNNGGQFKMFETTKQP